MLKSRNLIILAVVLAVLALISLWQSVSHERATSQSNTVAVLGTTFDPTSLNRLEVGFGQDKDALVLENLPDGWVVRTAFSHRANPDRVDNLLQTLNELQGEFRSDSADVLADYGFTDSTTVRIVGFGTDSDPVFELEVGRKPDRAVGHFVRQPGSNEVYLTDKSVLSNLGLYSGPAAPEAKHFLDLEAFKCEKTDVDALALTDADATVKIHKVFETQVTEPEMVLDPETGEMVPKSAPGDTTGHTGAGAGASEILRQVVRDVYEWQMTEPVEKIALKTKADAVLGSTCNIRGVDIADPNLDLAGYGLASPLKKAVVLLKDGFEHEITVGDLREAEDEKPAGHYLRVDNEETVWIVAEYLVKNIFKSYEELLPEDE